MKLASSVLIIAVLLTIAKLAMAAEHVAASEAVSSTASAPAGSASSKSFDPRYNEITTYLFCMSDDMSSQVTMEKDRSSIVFENSLISIDFNKAAGDVDVREATDIGFTVRKKSTGAFLAFRERALNEDDKNTGVNVKYHMQGVAQKPELPKTKSGTKILEAIARMKVGQIDAVIKCREIPHN